MIYEDRRSEVATFALIGNKGNHTSNKIGELPIAPA